MGFLALKLSVAVPDYRPAFHHTPSYRYGPQGSSGDTAGAVFAHDRWHVFGLSRSGIHHASTADLVHWKELGTVRNLDDSGGGVTVDPSDGAAVALSAGGLVAKLSVSTDADLQQWGPLSTVFEYHDDRRPAMPFPGNPTHVPLHELRPCSGDPLAPWRDPRDGQ